MLKDHERFNNVTAGIQSITIAIAVLVGGAWTFYTYVIHVPQERINLEKTQNELAKTQLDIATTKVAQEREGNYGLDISVDAKQERFAGSDYISALVKITNKGVENRFIDFREKPSLVVEHVEFDEDGNVFSLDSHEIKNVYGYIVLRTATTVNYPFMVRVLRKGFYRVSFDVELNPKEMVIHKQSGGPDEPGVSWGASTILLVK